MTSSLLQLKHGLYLFGYSGFLLALAYLAQRIVAKQDGDEDSMKKVAANLYKGVASLVATGGVLFFAVNLSAENLVSQLQLALRIMGLGGALIGIAYLAQLVRQWRSLIRNEKTYLGITGIACLIAAVATFLIAAAITKA